MTHPRPAQLLRYVLDELDADQRLELEAHVADCGTCRRRLEAERRLDEALLSTEPAPPAPGATRRALDGLWARVDGDDRLPEGEAAPVTPATPASWERRAAAAAAVMLMGAAAYAAWSWTSWSDFSAELNARRGEELADAMPDQGAAGEDAGDAVNGTRDVAGTSDTESDGGDAVDIERLAAVRGEVAEALVAAHELLPFDDGAFLAACDQSLAPVRAEGWSVTHMVRGHVVGPDGEVRSAALRWAVLDPASDTTVAQALEDPALVDETLSLLQEHPRDLQASRVLARSLGRLVTAEPRDDLAASDDRAGTALELLVTGGAAGVLADVRDRCLLRAQRLGAGPRERARALAVLEVMPAAQALDGWLRLAGSPAGETAARAAFLARAADRPDALAAAVSVRPAGDADRLLPWILQARLREAAPWVVARLGERPEDEVLLGAAAALADDRQLHDVFLLWRELRHRPQGAAVAALLESLTDAEASRRALGAGVPPTALDDLVELVSAWPPEARGTVLLGAFEALPAAADAGGHRAYVVTHLARLGTAAEGRRLLAWIEGAGAPDRALLPMVWAAATVLTDHESLTAWTRAGHDPRVLRQVVEARGPWPEQAPRPPRRLLRELDRSLRRVAPATQEESL